MTISPSQIAELRELVELEHTMSISHTQSSDYRKAEVALRIGVREKLPTLLDTLDLAWKVIEAAKKLAEYPDFRSGVDFQSTDGGKTWSEVIVTKQCPFCFRDLRSDKHSDDCAWTGFIAALLPFTEKRST